MSTIKLYVQDASGRYRAAESSLIIAEAKRRIGFRFRRGAELTSPAVAKEAIQLQLIEEENEVFGCLFLDLCAAENYVQ